MKHLQLLFLILIIGCSTKDTTTKDLKSNESMGVKSSSIQDEYAFTPDSIGFDSPEEVALQVIQFLQQRDTSKYFETAIPLEGQKYLFAQNLEYRPDIKNHKEFMNWLESRFARRMDNFLVRAGYITEIMEEDKGFKIDNASIDTITIEDVRIKNYGGFNRFIVGEWADVTVKMNYNKEDFFFEIPQIIKLKDKWFLYYPEYYLRTKKGLEFTKQRVEEINRKADEFWL